MSDFDPAAVPVRRAATVMLVDDRPNLSVLMLRRHARTVFAGGMWVFPGGAVDDTDVAVAEGPRSVGVSNIEAARRFGDLPGGEALAHWVAAAVETFEEAGLVLADLGARHDGVDGARLRADRQALNAGTRLLADVLDDHDLVLELQRMHYVAHWTTPVGSPRRFSARFFLARHPPGQVPVQDDGETVDAAWVEPAEAVARYEAGEWTMMTPTVRMLQCLAAFDSAGEAEAAASVDRPLDEARVLYVDGERYRIVLPGEDGYERSLGGIESGYIKL